MKLNNEELFQIAGGLSFNGTIVNALSRAIETVLEVGRSLGSAIRRIFNKNYCN